MASISLLLPLVLAQTVLPGTLDGGALPDGGVAAVLVPPLLLEDSPAAWPDSVEEDSPAGAVLLELLVSPQGLVDEVSLVQGVHPALDLAATSAATRLRFRPAELDGERVAVRVAFEYRFVRPPPKGTLRLVIRERGSRDPIAGAQVFTASGETLGETDGQGQLNAELEPGEHSLVFVSSGHQRATLTELVTAREERGVLVRLQREGVDAYQTVVQADRLRTDLGRVALRDEEVREVPGTLGDPLRVVMLMPGVASVASGVGYPVVRGSLPAATATYVDGVRVPILFHLLLGPSVVHPEAIDRIEFTPGLPSAQRGRLLSGTVEAQLRKVEGPFRAHLGADLINAGGMLQTRLPTGTEILAGGRFSYSAWLLAHSGALTRGAPGGGMTAQADFSDYLLSVEQPWGGGRTRLMLLGSSDHVGADLEHPDAADMAMVTRFHRLDLRDVRPLGLGELELGISAGTQAAGVVGAQRDVKLDLVLEQQDVGARAAWRWRKDARWRFAVGADVERLASGTRLGTEATLHPLLARVANGVQTGAWTELGWSDREWDVQAGVRTDLYHLVPGLTHWSVDPRLAVRRAFGPAWTVQLAAGMTHQPPTALLPVPVVDLSGLRWGLQEAVQLDGTVSWVSELGFEVQVNGYATLLTRSVEVDLERLLRDLRASGRLTSDPASRGSAAGLELMVRKHLGGAWYGWASYALQRSVREQRVVGFDARGMPTGEQRVEMPFAFDQTHVGNVALTVRLPGEWTVGAVARLQTGRPESGQLSTRTQVPDEDSLTGEVRWRNAGADEVSRLPPFFRLDLRAAKRWTFDDASLELSLDVLNATLSREVLGYEYKVLPGGDTSGPSLNKVPISFPLVLPMLGLKAEL